MNAKLWFGMAVALGLSACVIHTNREWVRDVAARDLDCPKSKIVVTHYTKNDQKKGVEGCGRRVTYVEVCRDGSCTWRQDPNAPPPQPAQEARK